MDPRNTEFLGLIDRAKIQSSQLEPSGGVLTLGLARQVADTANSLASPVLQAVGEIERFYQERYKD